MTSKPTNRRAAQSGFSGDSGALLEDLKRLYPREIDLSLGRIERLLSALGNPEAASSRSPEAQE